MMDAGIDRLHEQMMECERLKEELSFALDDCEEGSELEAVLAELLNEVIGLGLISMDEIDFRASQN